MGAPARGYHGLQRMARAGKGMLWRGYNTLLAGDLTGLQRVFGAGLYAGLPWRFWWPRWPDLGACWAFAAGVQCWAGRESARHACFAWMKPQHCAGIQYVMVWLSVWLSVWHRLGRACP